MQQLILGIDHGGSFTDCVVLSNQKIVFQYSVPSRQFDENELKKALKRKGIQPIAVCLTGKKKTSVFSNPVFVDEFQSTALGARFLSNQNRFVVASAGTGTAILGIDNEKAGHLAGTGVGGGTLEGLSRLLLQLDVVSAHRLSLNGKPRLDVTVRDIVGAGIGYLPGDATASNFGKPFENASKEDIAFSSFNLVAETVAVCACFGAEKVGLDSIVFVGRTSAFPFVQKRVKIACRLFNKKPFFPKNLELATAIGAALQSEK